jgi:hypothetical protein
MSGSRVVVIAARALAAVALPNILVAGSTATPARKARPGGDAAALRKQEAHVMPKVPDASTLTPSPLRNRIRVRLEAAPSVVWTLVGDLSRFPEFSSGLERVEATLNSSGTVTAYICHFKPLEEGGERMTSRERIRWYEPNRGYASSGEAGDDAFGLSNDLNLVTLEPSKDGTILTWDEYYDAQDLDIMKSHFDQALADIAENLIRRFGGELLEHHVGGPR